MFGLVPTKTTDAMRLGLRLEKSIINEYAQQFADATVSFPGILVHDRQPYITASPDAVLQTEEKRILVEVKTMLNIPKLYTKFKDQIQLNLWLSKCEHAVLLLYPTKGMVNNTIDGKNIVVVYFEIDSDWRLTFSKHATEIYESYLSWFYADPPDQSAGSDVVKLLLLNVNSMVPAPPPPKKRDLVIATTSSPPPGHFNDLDRVIGFCVYKCVSFCLGAHSEVFQTAIRDLQLRSTQPPVAELECYDRKSHPLAHLDFSDASKTMYTRDSLSYWTIGRLVEEDNALQSGMSIGTE